MKKSIKKSAKSTKSVVKASATKRTATKSIGRPHKYPDTAKIKMLTKENPYRAGSLKSKAFIIVSKAATVGAFLKAGGPMRRLLTMVEYKRCSVS